ncbi:helix-turn-helix domain-containing protein [Staphylococcus aureus]|nr:helix-turn-helix transcriptional regulator [Staphylococcus aureus]
MKFGELLDEYRNNLGLSINKLGELANVSPTYISRLQNNPEKKPSKKNLV